jgi:hypothetical protein
MEREESLWMGGCAFVFEIVGLAICYIVTCLSLQYIWDSID